MPAALETVLVFDIGGSHISAGLHGRSSSRLLASCRHPLPAADTTSAFLDTLEAAALESRVPHTLAPAGAAVAIAGPFDYDNGISRMNHKLSCLFDFDLKQAIARRFGWKPDQVLFLNDAEAFLAGELASGAARNVGRALGITLGTGIGSAFAIEGRLISSGSGTPPWYELWDRPYNGASVEDFLSTRALESSFLERTGHRLDVRSIASRASADPSARAVFELFGAHLGDVIASILFPYQPHAIILGGGIAHASPLFLPALTAALNGQAVSVHISPLMSEAPLLGAGVRWFGQPERR